MKTGYYVKCVGLTQCICTHDGTVDSRKTERRIRRQRNIGPISTEYAKFTQSAGNDPDDGLKGYTSGTVNIRRGNFIYTYNEKGHQMNATNAR